MNRARHKMICGGLLAACTVLFVFQSASVVDADAKDTDEAREQPVTVAFLTYGRGKTARCFTTTFLEDVGTMTNVRVETKPATVELADQKVFDYPFTVLSGEGMFTLTPAQRQNLSHYLTRGGFVLASPGCASKPWGASFLREIQQALPQAGVEKLTPDHPIFRSLHAIKGLRTISGDDEPHLYAVTLEGRVVGVFSPNGLNETDDASEGCACCCGHELRDGRMLKANILVYALTH